MESGYQGAWSPGCDWDPSWSHGAWGWDSGWSGSTSAWDWWETQATQDSNAWQPHVGLGPKTVADERNAQIHFTKTYQVLSEAIEKHPAAFKDKMAFLDLGCAPGGFSQRMLEELGPSGQGYGVTLPYQAGGFPMLLHDHRFHIQVCNLMELESPKDLECLEPVDVIMADAQDLSKKNPTNQREAKKKSKASRSKQGPEPEGVGAACGPLGIWALTLQEIMLGLGMLKAGGTFFFRFGWRGRGVQEEHWYREAIMRLLGLVLKNFDEVIPFKSEIYHQADPCFYVIAAGFCREGYADASLETRLREAIQRIILCESHEDLPKCIETLEEFSTPENHQRIDEILDKVGRVRAIGLSSRSTVQTSQSPEAQLVISPVPYHLTMPVLRERMECFGKIAYIKRRSHAVGVGADALIQFAQPAHAAYALEAVNDMKVLGPTVIARLGKSS